MKVYAAFEGSYLGEICATLELAKYYLEDRTKRVNTDPVIVIEDWTNVSVPESRPVYWRYFNTKYGQCNQHIQEMDLLEKEYSK